MSLWCCHKIVRVVVISFFKNKRLLNLQSEKVSLGDIFPIYPLFWRTFPFLLLKWKATRQDYLNFTRSSKRFYNAKRWDRMSTTSFDWNEYTDNMRVIPCDKLAVVLVIETTVTDSRLRRDLFIPNIITYWVILSTRWLMSGVNKTSCI